MYIFCLENRTRGWLDIFAPYWRASHKLALVLFPDASQCLWDNVLAMGKGVLAY